MRSIHNYVQAVKARREENGDEGFSLIELIVVVVILGILAAVAIPVFMGLQGQAEQAATDAVAANAASQAAADLAQDKAVTTASFDKLRGSSSGTPAVYEYSFTVAANPTSATLSIDNFCVTATHSSSKTAKSGPGC